MSTNLSMFRIENRIYLKVTIFLRVLMFVISVDQPKNAKFCTRKRCFKSKLQKNVPANNCHLKVQQFKAGSPLAYKRKKKKTQASCLIPQYT